MRALCCRGGPASSHIRVHKSSSYFWTGNVPPHFNKLQSELYLNSVLFLVLTLFQTCSHSEVSKESGYLLTIVAKALLTTFSTTQLTPLTRYLDDAVTGLVQGVNFRCVLI